VVPGCPACKKRINTSNGFIDHIADDILPDIIQRVMAQSITKP
jgi:hypothetical protein